MTPALGLFYAGMIRSKNVLSVMMQSFVACGLISIQWMLFGYSIAFGPDPSGFGHGFFGNLSYAFLHGVSCYVPEGTVMHSYGATVPHMSYCMFQLMFAIITPALISGAVVERMKFSAYCVFIVLWATFVYDPIAHMVWSHHGFLAEHGALDFAGGSAVEMASGFSALTLAMIVGRREESQSDELRPHNLPYSLIGAGILWFGWYGFNAGSAITGNHLATAAFVNTHIAGAAGAIVWMFWDWLIYKKPTALGFASGIVAGLVAITQACGFLDPVGALVTGILGGTICFFAIRIKNLLSADDSLDVFGVHGIGGLVGCLCVGFFSLAFVNSSSRNGWLTGGDFMHSMFPQLLDAGITIFTAVFGTLLMAYVTKLLCGGLRTTSENEVTGLDLTDHGETGYSAENTGGIYG
jgi:Amt family ammonium transporter